MRLAAAIPPFEAYRRAVAKQLEHEARVQAEIERLALYMLYGNGGALLGVLVERGPGWVGLSLRDPDDDPRVEAGTITDWTIAPHDVVSAPPPDWWMP